MNSLNFFDRSLPPSKASPFVNHTSQAKAAHKSHADKPVVTTSRGAGGKRPTKVDAKSTKPIAVTIATAAIMLEVSTRTIRRWITSGRLHSFQVGRVIRIPIAQLAQLTKVNE